MGGLSFSMSVANYTIFLADTQNKGFNSIWVKTPQCPNGTQPDGSGNLPFLNNLGGGSWSGYTGEDSGGTWTLNTPTLAPDFTTPNGPFWTNFDAFLAQCEQRNILVIWFPSYVGFHNTDWWMNVMVANGATKMQTYGAWVASRFQNHRNLILGLGGDKGVTFNTFSSGENAVLAAFHAGIKSLPMRTTLFGAEWDRGTISKDLYPAESNLNLCYAAATDINNQGARGRATTPAVPAFFIEYPLETTGGAEGFARRFMIWATFSTIGGYCGGHGTLTDFNPATFQSYLSTTGSLDAARFHGWWSSWSWQTFAPANSVITAGGGTPNTDDQCAAVRASTGAVILAYCPPAHTGTITIDMSQMSGATLSRWWDPTNATYTADASGLSNSGTRAFTKPGTNSAGQTDWVLTLTA